MEYRKPGKNFFAGKDKAWQISELIKKCQSDHACQDEDQDGDSQEKRYDGIIENQYKRNNSQQNVQEYLIIYFTCLAPEHGTHLQFE